MIKMSFSEALKYAEGARKKIIREWAEENCFGYPQQGIAKMEYYESGFKELKKRIPDVTEDEIKGFEYDGIYDEYELSPSEYGFPSPFGVLFFFIAYFETLYDKDTEKVSVSFRSSILFY